MAIANHLDLVKQLDRMPDDSWETIVRWGLSQLLEDQETLLAILTDRARFRHERNPRIDALTELRVLMSDLGLRLTISP